MVKQASPALKHVVTGLIADESVICSNTSAAGNTIVNSVDNAALLVPAANVAVWGVEESHTATASIVFKTAGTTAAVVDSVGHKVAMAGSDVVSTAASAAVSTQAHANTIAMCAAEGAMTTCAVMLVLNSDIAYAARAGSTAASTAGPGSQAGSTVIGTVGSIVSIDGQRSSIDCKARDHGLCISSKCRTSSGGDNVNTCAAHTIGIAQAGLHQPQGNHEPQV
jgi:hypothetical protein